MLDNYQGVTGKKNDITCIFEVASLIFLQNGIELARKIREQDSGSAIIFITSCLDYALEGYDVNALHYLMKALDICALERIVVSD